MDHDPRPIGVFDSGVGGLTVLKALWRRLPGESTLYLGDTARVPYGTKSSEVVTRYALMAAEFLRARDIKLLVVACNTASAFAMEALRSRLPIPVVGVVEPGAHAAAERSRGGAIGVIGTAGTIRSGAYQRALAAVRPGLSVRAQACPLFVPLAEEGWTAGDVPRLVAREYLTDAFRSGLDTLVLGCTHYPLLHAVIAEAVGDDVALVDSAEATAEWVKRELVSRRAFGDGAKAVVHRFFVTDTPDRFLDVGARFLGRPVSGAEQVDLTP